jgi:hypothetical protein
MIEIILVNDVVYDVDKPQPPCCFGFVTAICDATNPPNP